MTERSLVFIDVEAESKTSTSVKERNNSPLGACTDNSFRFNFFTGNSSPLQEKPPAAEYAEAPPAQVSFTGPGSDFTFNFQIPPAVEDMDTTENANTSSSSNQQIAQEEKSSVLQDGASPPEQSAKSKTKKKKSGKKTPSDPEPQQKPEESQKDDEQSAEEQLNRQLDWCIEQLELGLRSQKGTPKQKEEASRALKTLRSSKAPLVKKRQVMRAMAGDYRKKMEEEKSKQFKLIHSEVASAQVKVVSDCPKKSFFHRKAEVKSQPLSSEDHLPLTRPQDDEKSNPQTQEGTSSFVFVPSKEEFSFNFF